MSQNPHAMGASMAATFQKVLDFAAASGNPVPRMGKDIEPIEVEVMKAEGAIRVRATDSEVTGFEFGEAFRKDPNALAAQLVAAVNEAMARARKETMEQFRGMPTQETIKANLASLQNEVLESYKTEMARLEDMTKGIASHG